MTFEQYLIDKNITDLSPHIKALMLKAWEAATEEEAAKYKPISVDERLPERNKKSFIWSDKVIAYTKDGNQLMAFYDHYGKEWEDVECIRLDDVTHWLPVPRLPI